MVFSRVRKEALFLVIHACSVIKTSFPGSFRRCQILTTTPKYERLIHPEFKLCAASCLFQFLLFLCVLLGRGTLRLSHFHQSSSPDSQVPDCTRRFLGGHCGCRYHGNKTSSHIPNCDKYTSVFCQKRIKNFL